jgi:hypothetical protein
MVATQKHKHAKPINERIIAAKELDTEHGEFELEQTERTERWLCI